MNLEESFIAKSVFGGSREQLLEALRSSHELKIAFLKKLILQGDRIDILAREVLGYMIAPEVHLPLIRHQLRHGQSQALIFRGCGKTTIGTIVKSIHILVKHPEARILIASKTASNAADMLKEVKTHFESNEKFREMFGDLVGLDRWGTDAIEVRRRGMRTKEPSIQTQGIEGTLPSKHFDVILADDLVDEDNSRTRTQREKTQTWFYKVLMPTLEPPTPERPYAGQLHLSGTRYHWDDLYGHLLAHELSGEKTLVIPALNTNEESPWPEKFSQEWLLQMRERMGSIIFNSQYQCDVELMKGSIFRYDDCKRIEPGEVPKNGQIYMGVDLAIGEQDSHDCFAIVVLKFFRESGLIYVLDAFEGHLRFAEQTAKILEMAAQHKPLKIAIETNAYQKAQYQELRRSKPDLPLISIQTQKDKISRAWALAARFERGQVHFFNKLHDRLVEHLVLFPGHKFKDLFDAFDLAVSVTSSRARQITRRVEPGLI